MLLHTAALLQQAGPGRGLFYGLLVLASWLLVLIVVGSVWEKRLLSTGVIKWSVGRAVGWSMVYGVWWNRDGCIPARTKLGDKSGPHRVCL